MNKNTVENCSKVMRRQKRRTAEGGEGGRMEEEKVDGWRSDGRIAGLGKMMIDYKAA